MTLVIDASVALKWFFQERTGKADAPAALDLLAGYASGKVSLIAPVHFMTEVCAVLAREAPGAAAANLSSLLGLGIPVRDDALVLDHAMGLAGSLDHHLFDTLYHSLALHEDATLVTADKRYALKARHLGSLVLLEDYSPESPSRS